MKKLVLLMATVLTVSNISSGVQVLTVGENGYNAFRYRWWHNGPWSGAKVGDVQLRQGPIGNITAGTEQKWSDVWTSRYDSDSTFLVLEDDPINAPLKLVDDLSHAQWYHTVDSPDQQGLYSAGLQWHFQADTNKIIDELLIQTQIFTADITHMGNYNSKVTGSWSSDGINWTEFAHSENGVGNADTFSLNPCSEDVYIRFLAENSGGVWSTHIGESNWEHPYQYWSYHYNFEGTTTVPEPATIVLLGLGGLLLKRRKA